MPVALITVVLVVPVTAVVLWVYVKVAVTTCVEGVADVGVNVPDTVHEAPDKSVPVGGTRGLLLATVHVVENEDWFEVIAIPVAVADPLLVNVNSHGAELPVSTEEGRGVVVVTVTAGPELVVLVVNVGRGTRLLS